MKNLTRTAIILILFVLFQSSPAFAQDDIGERLLKLTKEITTTNSYEVGIEKANEFIRLAPELGEGYAMRALVYFKAKKYSETVADVNKGLSIGVDKDMVVVMTKIRGLSNSQLGEYESAIADYSKVIELGDNDYKVYQLRALAYRKTGKNDLADKDDRMAEKLQGKGPSVEKKDDDLSALLKTSGDQFENGDYKEAIVGFTKIIDIVGEGEGVYAIYFSRGRSYFELKNYDAAMSDYNKTVALRPDLPETYTFRGEIYLVRKDYSQAIIEFDKALKIKPDEILALARRGETNLIQKKYTIAIKDFDAVLKMDDEFYSAWFWRAESHFGNKDYKQSLRDISQFIKLQDDVPDAYKFRAKVLRKLGRDIEAERDDKKSKELFLTN